MSKATTPKTFTTLAALALAVLALVHVLRLVFALEVVIGGMIVPLWFSIPAAVVAAGLSLMVRRETRG